MEHGVEGFVKQNSLDSEEDLQKKNKLQLNSVIRTAASHQSIQDLDHN